MTLPTDNFPPMIGVSVFGHFILLVVVLWVTHPSTSQYIDVSKKGPLNMIWATTITGPKETAPWKLPGPQVLPTLKKEAPEKKVVESKQPANKTKEDLDRRKLLRQAVANLHVGSETRPEPKLDNFPSDSTLKKEGLPSGPLGGTFGSFNNNPDIMNYKQQIQQIITDHFVWLKQRDTLLSEITFQIDSNGNILSPTISKSSGDIAFDNASLRAIQKSSPLPAPSTFKLDDLVREIFVIKFDPRMK